jgi:aminoglycoside 6'-N-acetyltransferase I
MQIRAIRPEDRREWVRMRDLLWPDSLEDHERDTLEYFAWPDQSLATFVVDRLDGRLGGFIELGQRNYAEDCTTSPVAYIEGWFIDEDLRRQGLGTALVREGERWARERGLREIASDVVIDNEISIRSHKAIGYEEVVRIVCFRKDLGETV